MKEKEMKANIRIPEKNQVDLQTLQFGRGSGLNLKTVFPTLYCITQRDNFTLNWDTESLYKI